MIDKEYLEKLEVMNGRQLLAELTSWQNAIGFRHEKQDRQMNELEVLKSKINTLESDYERLNEDYKNSKKKLEEAHDYAVKVEKTIVSKVDKKG